MIDPLGGALPAPIGTGDAGLVTGGRAARAPGPEAAGPDFATLITEALAGVSGQLRKAEAVSIAGIRGDASTQAVVEQVMAAEQSLQTAIAVRDKIVAAYLEISRMPI